MSTAVEIRLLGDLEVWRDAQPIALPRTRKTRALLGYLATERRPHRRERLCEMFWDVPDDPRGALRWSLSKLRPLVDDADTARIVADRQVVSLSDSNLSVDLQQLRATVARGVDAASTDALKAAVARFKGPLLDGMDLPACPAFQAWLVSAREEVRSLQRQILDCLVDRLSASPEDALPFARARVALDPENEAAWAAVIGFLQALGRSDEAEAQYGAAKGVLAEFSGSTHVLEAALQASPKPAAAEPRPVEDLHQEIRFCRAADGVQIAYATAGHGPPLVKAANWLNHIEYDWESPIWGHCLRGLAKGRTLLRYDPRGVGLSDRNAEDLSLDAWVGDLEAVVDNAGLDRFPLLGISKGCAVSVAYAMRNPGRVTHLILYGGRASGILGPDAEHDEPERIRAVTVLMRMYWGQDNPGFRQMFTSMFIPGATPEQAAAFNELQRRSSSPEEAARYFEAIAPIDVRDLLQEVNIPTLVMHARGDEVVPIESGRQLAAGIPGARFVTLPGRNHLFLEGEPGAKQFIDEIDRFLAT